MYFVYCIIVFSIARIIPLPWEEKRRRPDLQGNLWKYWGIASRPLTPSEVGGAWKRQFCSLAYRVLLQFLQQKGQKTISGFHSKQLIFVQSVWFAARRC